MTRYARLFSVTVLATILACGGGDSTGAPPAVATIQVTPGQDTLVTLGRTRQFSAVPLDAQGHPVSGVTIAWSSSNPGVASVDGTSGIVTAVGNGLSVIRATVGTGASAVSGQATLAVSQFIATVVVTPPTAGLNTVGVTQAFSAVAKDSSNATVGGVRFVWQSSDPSVAVVDTNGVARSKGPGQTTITASARGTPGNATLSVTQNATTLVFAVGPTATLAGEAINPAIQVEVRDAAGNLVAGSRAAITLDFAGNPGSATLHGSTTVNAVGGIASFSGISIETAGSGYSLSASSGAMAPATSGAFPVSPATPAALEFVTLSATDTAGQPLPFEVHAVDRFGNFTPSVVGSVFIRIVSNPTGAALINGNFFPTMTGGIADLSQSTLSIQKAGAGYKLSATGFGGATGLDSAISAFLTVNPASAAAVVFPFSPGNPFFGNYLIGQQVRVQDLFANLVTTPATVTIALGTNPWGATLSGTLIRSGTGTIVFDSLLLNKPGVGYTVIASATGLVPDTNTAFNLPLSFPTGEAAGGSHACVLATGGVPACWGDNTYGQLGHPGGGDSVPVLVTPRRVFTQLAAGTRHTCGLDGSGAAWCWGDNSTGQLGNSVGATSSVPVAVGGGHQFTTLAAGGGHTCGVAVGGTLYCWGANTQGELGDSGKVAAFTYTPTAVYGAITYRAVAAGETHTCALAAADSTPRCWGSDAFGQLGDSTLTTGGSDTAVVVRGAIHARGISGGAWHTCVSTATFAYCWGRNNHGQVGNDNLGVNADKPDTVNGGTGTFSGTISLGGDHSCVMSGFNLLYCWGSNAAGELGNGLAPTDAAHATAVSSGGGGALNVAAGGSHTCARLSPGGVTKLYCWGSNATGQVGDGTRTNRSVPAIVKEQ